MGVKHEVDHLVSGRHVETFAEPVQRHLGGCHGIEEEILQVLLGLRIGEKRFCHVPIISTGSDGSRPIVCHLVNWSDINTCTPTHLLPTAAITRSAHVIMSAIVISSTISFSQPKDSCHFFQRNLTICTAIFIQLLGDFLRFWCETNGIFGINCDFANHWKNVVVDIIGTGFGILLGSLCHFGNWSEAADLGINQR